MKIVLDLSVDELKELLRLSNKGDKFVKCSKRQIIKSRQDKEWVITYIVDYGFRGGYESKIDTQIEKYTHEKDAYDRYYLLRTQSYIRNIKIEEREGVL